jgi:D-threo-aldose 1-dehydrogenase
MRHLEINQARGVPLTLLSHGTAAVGGLYCPVGSTAGTDAIAHAINRGIGYFDTAPLYGPALAEERLGDAMAQTESSSVVLSTKVGRVLEPGSLPPGNVYVEDSQVVPVFDFSRAGIRRSFEGSLERLGRDRIEIVFIHDPDDHFEQAFHESLPELHRMRDEGLLDLIGVGMNQSAMPTRFIEDGGIDIVLIAGRYSIIDQTAAADLMPAAAKHGAAVVVGGVFNSGVYMDPTANGRFNYEPAPQHIIDKVLAVHEVCREFDVNPAAAALQFPLRHPATATVLSGGRSPAEIDVNIEQFNADIPDELWAAFIERGFHQPVEAEL